MRNVSLTRALTHGHQSFVHEWNEWDMEVHPPHLFTAMILTVHSHGLHETSILLQPHPSKGKAIILAIVTIHDVWPRPFPHFELPSSSSAPAWFCIILNINDNPSHRPYASEHEFFRGAYRQRSRHTYR